MRMTSGKLLPSSTGLNPTAGSVCKTLNVPPRFGSAPRAARVASGETTLPATAVIAAPRTKVRRVIEDREGSVGRWWLMGDSSLRSLSARPADVGDAEEVNAIVKRRFNIGLIFVSERDFRG